MNLKMWRVTSSGWFAAFALVAAAAYGARPAARPVGSAAITQDTFNLERRISVVEQRLNSVELSVNRLEQQSRLSSPAPPSNAGVRDAELELLRTEIELLQDRKSTRLNSSHANI